MRLTLSLRAKSVLDDACRAVRSPHASQDVLEAGRTLEQLATELAEAMLLGEARKLGAAVGIAGQQLVGYAYLLGAREQALALAQPVPMSEEGLACAEMGCRVALVHAVLVREYLPAEGGA